MNFALNRLEHLLRCNLQEIESRRQSAKENREQADHEDKIVNQLLEEQLDLICAIKTLRESEKKNAV